MSDPIQRTEILEERGNRDAYHLAQALLLVFALFLAGLLYVLSRVTVISLTLPERAPTKPARSQLSTFSAQLASQTLSTTAAPTAGECSTPIALVHRSAAPARRGFIPFRPTDGAATSRPNQPAGSRLTTGARFPVPCASNTAADSRPTLPAG